MPQQQQQPENLSFQSRVFAEVGSSSSNNNNCQPENPNFQSGCLSPRNGEECATVHMLQAARLPERHEKLVKLQFNQQDIVNTEHLLLEPDKLILGLDMQSTLLNLDKDVCATVPVYNYNMDAKPR